MWETYSTTNSVRPIKIWKERRHLKGVFAKNERRYIYKINKIKDHGRPPMWDPPSDVKDLCPKPVHPAPLIFLPLCQGNSDQSKVLPEAG